MDWMRARAMTSAACAAWVSRAEEAWDYMAGTRWLAQARQGKVCFGLEAGDKRQATSMPVLSCAGWLEADETADMWSGPRGLFCGQREGGRVAVRSGQDGVVARVEWDGVSRAARHNGR